VRLYQKVSLAHLDPTDPAFVSALRSAFEEFNLFLTDVGRELSRTQTGSTSAIGVNEPFVTAAPSTELTAERTLAASSPLGISDGGPGANISVVLSSAVPINLGGTGAATADGAFTNLVGTDHNSNTILTRTPIASAVNYLDLSNAAASGAPVIRAAGTDTNIDLNLVPKGTGGLYTSAAFLDEVSGSGVTSPSAGHVRHYIKAFGTQNRPFWKDENGIEYLGMQPRIVRKASDESTSATSPADCAGLSFSLEASKSYHFVWYIYSVGSSSAAPCQVGVNLTNAPGYIIYAVSAASGTTTFYSEGTTTKDTALAVPTSAGSTITQHILSGYLDNSANTDTLQFRFCTSGALHTTTIKKGSWGVIYEVPS
jgi:hypothetical protein